MPQLGRFLHTVRSTLGLAISGASVALYREGATVNGNQSGTSPLAVTVHHAGKIATGNDVFVNTVSGTTYSATRTSDTVITLAGFAGTLALTSGDRLTPSTNPATLYSDDQGGSSTTNPLTSSSTGIASCWMEYGAYEVLVSGGGATTTLFQALVTPTEMPGQVRYADAFARGSTTGGIQEAIDDLPSTGGKVVLSAGTTYTVTTGISTSQVNLEICGGGGLGERTAVGNGSTVISVSGAITGFTFNPAAASTIFQGPVLRDFCMVGTSSGVAGIRIKRTNNYVLENVNVTEFTAGIGIESDGTGNVNQYGMYLNTYATKCLTGFKNTLTNGLRIISGGGFGVDSGSPAAGSIGINHVSGDTLFLIGPVMQGYEKIVNLQDGENVNIHSMRFEQFGTGYAIIANNTEGLCIVGGSINNSINGSTGTAISLGAACLRTTIIMPGIASVTTVLSDSSAVGQTDAILQGTAARFGRSTAIAGEHMTVASVSAAADIATFLRATNTVAAGARINLALWDANSADKVYAALIGAILTNTAGAHDGELQVQESRSGTLTLTTRFRDGGAIGIKDGITAPATLAGWGLMYIDTADGDLKIKFGDGTVKTIVVDT